MFWLPPNLVSKAAAATFALAVCAPVQATALGAWSNTRVNAGTSLGGVVFGDGVWVTVGELGAISRTTDSAARWTVVSEPSALAATLESVAHACGEFVATGEFGTILRSADGGITWNAESSGTTQFLNDVTYGEGRWVAVGGAIDGSAAAVRTSAAGGGPWLPAVPGTSAYLSGVAYGGGQFVAVGLGGAIIRSDDGTNWTAVASPTFRYLSGITFADGQFVAVGQRGSVLRSEDGSSWEVGTVGVGTWLFGVTHADGLFIACGEGGAMYTSPDAETWTPVASGVANDLFAIARGAVEVIAVGGAEGLSVSRVASADPPPTDTYLGWQIANFGAAALADTGLTGAAADPDCDGIPNAVEWSQDSDPLAAGTPVPWGISRQAPGATAVIEYRQVTARPLWVQLVVSDNLRDWNPSGITASVSDGGAGIEILRFPEPSPTDSARRFSQLRFEP